MEDHSGTETACEGICDFCSSPDLFYAYLAYDFSAAAKAAPTPGIHAWSSLRAWLACRECTCLIEVGKWEELLERALLTFHEVCGTELNMTPEDERLIREFFQRLHIQFWNFQASRTPTATLRSSFSTSK
jgi:hypothetical protein